MGNNYLVLPTGTLDDESRAYLEQEGDPIPASPAGRWPTMRELRTAVETFHKPDELLAVQILERLARACGPIVLFEASGTTSVLVTGGEDPEAVMERWKRR